MFDPINKIFRRYNGNQIRTDHIKMLCKDKKCDQRHGRVSRIFVLATGKESTLFECQCILHESANWGRYFYVSNWRRNRHFTWSFEPREGLAVCTAKGVPSFLSYLKTLSIGQVPGIEPATSLSAVKRSIDWAKLILPDSSVLAEIGYKMSLCGRFGVFLFDSENSFAALVLS